MTPLRIRPDTRRAFSLLELLLTVLIIMILAALLLPVLQGAKSKAQRARCGSNMRQLGLAFLSWAHDHEDKFPMQVSTNNHGTAEFVQIGTAMQAYRHFQALSNELAVPTTLVCPVDGRIPARNFEELQNTNLSYGVNARAAFGKSESVLVADRNVRTSGRMEPTYLQFGPGDSVEWSSTLHSFRGNILFADGHLEAVANPGAISEFTAGGEVLLIVPQDAPVQIAASDPAPVFPQPSPVIIDPPPAAPPSAPQNPVPRNPVGPSTPPVVQDPPVAPSGSGGPTGTTPKPPPAVATIVTNTSTNTVVTNINTTTFIRPPRQTPPKVTPSGNALGGDAGDTGVPIANDRPESVPGDVARIVTRVGGGGQGAGAAVVPEAAPALIEQPAPTNVHMTAAPASPAKSPQAPLAGKHQDNVPDYRIEYSQWYGKPGARWLYLLLLLIVALLLLYKLSHRQRKQG